MSNIGELAVFQEDSAFRDDAMARSAPENSLPLRVVNNGMSAIEYIVETAEPGEVIFVNDGDYYNPYLWNCYDDLTT